MLGNNSSLIFVCTGNTCRSPMAEYLALEMALKKGLDIKTASRGTSASQKSGFSLGPTLEACRAVRAIYPQSRIYKHKPAPLTFEDLEQEGLILTMQEDQRDKILSEAQEFIPDLESRVFSLKEFALVGGEFPLDVKDPMVGDCSYGYESSSSPDRQTNYHTTRDEIIQCLDAILSNPSPDIKQLIALRGQRKQAFIQKGIDADIGEYQTILNLVSLAPEKEIIELTYSQISDIESPEKVPKTKDYLLPIIEQIAGHVKTKGITLTSNKAYLQSTLSSPTVVSSPDVANAVAALDAEIEGVRDQIRQNLANQESPAVQGTPKKRNWLASLFNWR